MSAVVGSSTRTSLGAAHGAAPLHFVSSEGLVTQCKRERQTDRQIDRQRQRQREERQRQTETETEGQRNRDIRILLHRN